jgi:arginine exporter protein ArgO
MSNDLSHSVRIAGLLGPTLIALTVTEWMNLGVFFDAIGPSFGPHVYLNGTLIFIAGLAMVRAHNRWVRAWPVLITIVGWFAMLAGLARMAAPLSAQRVGQSAAIVYGSLIVLLVIGLVLTVKAYGSSRQ